MVPSGRRLVESAGLFRTDNSVKPTYTALTGKIRGEWRIAESLHTSAAGELVLEGFRGDYELLCEGRKVSFTLNGKKERIDIEL
jgi:hypothetical protein